MSNPPAPLSTWARNVSPSPTLAVGAKAKAMQAAGEDVCGFAAGEPDFDTPEHIKEAAIRAMRAGKTKYTDVGGTAELKSAVRDKFIRENGLKFAADELIVSTGAKQAIFNALLCTVESGDKVIVPAPCWVSYPDVVRLAGGSSLAIL